MATLVIDPILEQELLAERQAMGGDRYDEVWDGVYIMAPLADNEHQDLAVRLAAVLQEIVGWSGLGRVFAGTNVTDRKTNWKRNFRCPDVAVFMAGGTAQDRKTHWFGGPDLAIEIVSPRDRSREKLDFYARVGTRELMIIDRDPWTVELHRLAGGRLMPAGTIQAGAADALISEVVGLEFNLAREGERTVLHVRHAATGRAWRT